MFQTHPRLGLYNGEGKSKEIEPNNDEKDDGDGCHNVTQDVRGSKGVLL